MVDGLGVPLGSGLAIERLSRRLFAMERYAIEGFLLLCSQWAAWAMWSSPGPLPLSGGVHLWIATIDPSERHWALLILAGAILKGAGLLLCLALHRPNLGITLRCIGLAISGFFWFGLGLSILANNHLTISGVPLMLLGASAWWTLVRFPAMPREQ